VPGGVADHQTAEATVADQDVGAHAKEEERHPVLPGGEDRRGQLIRRARLMEEVGRTADLEGGVGGEDLAGPDPVRAEVPAERVERGRLHGQEISSMSRIRRT
jgi:hypothetical protein